MFFVILCLCCFCLWFDLDSIMSLGLNAGNDIWYLISVLCFVALVLSIIPLTHTLYHLWIKKTEKISNSTKIVVSLSLILLFINVCDHTFNRICQWIPGGFGIGITFCYVHIWTVSVAYYIGKSLMYSYFVLRAETIFKFSAFAYHTKTVFCALISINALSILFTVAWPILDTGLVKISTIEKTGGKVCEISSADYHFDSFLLKYYHTNYYLPQFWMYYLV